MGICCSCCGSGDENGATTRETELQAQRAAKSLAISAKMSAPSLKDISTGKISGHGLAVAGVALEQDAGYWEWHVSLPARTHMDTILFGVTGKKDRKFYEDLKDKEIEEGTFSEVNGTQYMRRIEVQNGDVVGVAVQQSDLPMVQFTLNGELVHEAAINRFRGTVYPAICLPESGVEQNLQVQLVMIEDKFAHLSPGPRFGPVIVARSIV